MSPPRQLKLGFLLHGNGVGWGDWRHNDASPSASTDFGYYKRQAQLAESGKFDFLFVADSVHITPQSSPHYLNRFEPISILSALAGVTTHIGLVGTLTVSYTEPFNVARQFASLDLISGGRAGWNVVTSSLEGAAANFGRPGQLAHNVRYEIAAEYLDVVQGLWDSWEDDALTHDKASGRFFDPEKLHQLDHHGKFFSVRGPLNIARSPQGQPVIFQAGASEDGLNFATRYADAVFVSHNNFEQAKAHYREVKSRAAGFGRGSVPLVVPGLRPVIGRTAAEAQEKYQEFAELTSIEDALRLLARMFNDHDFTVYDLDAPFPDVARYGLNSNQSAVLKICQTARERNHTLRQAALEFATPPGEFNGTPAHIADVMQRWLEEEAADGFNFYESIPHQLDLFVETVVPILQERGIFRNQYEGATLRDRLGLPFPENRHTAARRTGIAAE